MHRLKQLFGRLL